MMNDEDVKIRQTLHAADFVIALAVAVGGALLILLSGCSVAPMGRAPAALEEAPDLSTPDAPAPDMAEIAAPAGQCGNGNNACGAGQLCVNGDCITVCGTNQCALEMAQAFQMCGGDALAPSARKLAAIKARDRR